MDAEHMRAIKLPGACMSHEAGLPRKVDVVLAAARRMDIITWLVVGLVAGALASAVVRGSGFGLIGNIVLGIAGAVVGGWTFQRIGWQPPLAGVAGTIAVAFAGAVIVLVALRLLVGTPVRR
jgi:uncharacterized membrane protein YeaQ/YmgE (transglycosylase-associated protein family)